MVKKYQLGEEILSTQGQSHKEQVKKLKELQRDQLRENLETRVIHGVFAKEANKPGVDNKASHRWLTHGRLQAQTEAIITAGQDGVLHTAAYQTRVLKTMSDETCRACGTHAEMIGHILTCCELYKWSLIKDRHDRVLYQLTRCTVKKLGLELPKQMRAPGGMIRNGIISNKQTEVLIDQCIPTIRPIEERKPDLVVRMHNKERILIFEVAACWEPLIQEREKQKNRKYQELAADLATQTGYKVTTIPVVMGTSGIVRGLRKHLK